MPLVIANAGEMTERRRVIKRRRRLTEDEKKRIIDYRKEGRSYAEISVLMGGLPISTIERYARTVKRGQRRTEQQETANAKPQTPPVEVAAEDVLPPKQTILPDAYYELQEIAKKDYENPVEMLDSVVRVLPPMSDEDKETWAFVINTIWQSKKETKNKEETVKFIRALMDVQLLEYTQRRYPQQLPLVFESMSRGDRILARLDEIVLLLRDLSEEIRRQGRNKSVKR
ncbi:MAG: hypothetical protein ABSG92_07220 [Conexivisphaerales archaeon]